MAPTKTPAVDPLAEMAAKLRKLEEENAALKAAKGTISIKAGPSGTVCVYGLGQRPFSAYPKQWETLATVIQDVIAYAKANPDKVSQGKDDKRFEAAKAQAKATYEARKAGGVGGAAVTVAPKSTAGL